MTALRREPESAWTVAGAVLTIVVLVVAYRWVHHLRTNLGVDLLGPLDGARVVARGSGSVYSDRAYTYLPSSALIFRPVAGTGIGFFHAMAYVDVAAMLITAYGSCFALIKRPWWLLAAGALALLVFKGEIAVESGANLNLNMDLGAAALLALLLMRSERWSWGVAVLAVSVLIKPVLVPLLVVPLFYGKWRPIVGAIVTLACVEGVAASVVPGGWRLSELHHNLSYWPAFLGRVDQNLTLAYVGRSHGVPSAACWLVRLGIIVAVLAAGLRARRGTDPVVVGYAVLLASMLVGSYFEASYCFLLIPLPAVCWLMRRQRAAALVLLAASVVYFAPLGLDHGHGPVGVWCASATIALVALLAASFGSAGPGVTSGLRPEWLSRGLPSRVVSVDNPAASA